MKIKNYIEEKTDFSFDFIIMQLTNDESSTDEEMIQHLSNETKISKNKIFKLVKKERNNFLQGKLINIKDAIKVVKKYIN